MSNDIIREKMFQCPNCMKEYTFDEWFNMLDTLQMTDGTPEKTKTCTCGHRFYMDKPKHQTYYKFTHHITVLHWLFNKLSLGRYCKPVQIDGMVSAVHLEMNHGFGGKPIYWEVMVFADAENKLTDSDEFGYRLESYCERRNYSMELIEADHKEYVDWLKAGKYLIEYQLRKKDGKLCRGGWILSLREEYQRYFHNVCITDDQKIGWNLNDVTFALEKGGLR